MRAKIVIVWMLQLVVTAILLSAAWPKLSSHPSSIYIFSSLGMEPNGRFIIGVIELCASAFLLSNRLAATGALLAVGTMLGAIIAHASVLGVDVLGDGGQHILLLAAVLVSAVIIALVRRDQLPLIGGTFGDVDRMP